MDSTQKGLLLGCAGSCFRDSLDQLPGLSPSLLEAAIAQAHDDLAKSPYATARIETLERRAQHPLLQQCALGDPAFEDAMTVAWFVTAIRSADSILLADNGCLNAAGIESALRALVIAVASGHSDAVLEPLVTALLDAAHDGYGTRVELLTERCPQTGGLAIVIGPELRTSCPQPGATRP